MLTTITPTTVPIANYRDARLVTAGGRSLWAGTMLSVAVLHTEEGFEVIATVWNRNLPPARQYGSERIAVATTEMEALVEMSLYVDSARSVADRLSESARAR